MDVIFFENDIFCQIFYIKLNKIVWNYYYFLKDLFEDFFKNISHKTITKVSRCGPCYLVCTPNPLKKSMEVKCGLMVWNIPRHVEI